MIVFCLLWFNQFSLFLEELWDLFSVDFSKLHPLETIMLLKYSFSSLSFINRLYFEQIGKIIGKQSRKMAYKSNLSQKNANQYGVQFNRLVTLKHMILLFLFLLKHVKMMFLIITVLIIEILILYILFYFNNIGFVIR